VAPSLRRVTTIFNPKTAPYYSKALDIEIPPSLIARADEVIE
jgi:hypothetical protein